MLCKKCGNELLKTARFCTHCGAPVDDTKTENTISSTVPTTATFAGQTMPASTAAASGQPVSAPVPATQDQPSPAPTADAPAPTADVPAPATDAPAPAADAPAQDLIVRQDRIRVIGDRLLVDGVYYRKTGRRFRKKHGQLGVPLSLIKAATVHHTPNTVKIITSLLLFLVFAAGAAIAGRFDWNAWNKLNTPYRQQETQQLESELALLAEYSDTQLQELDAKLDETAGEYTSLEAQLEEYRLDRQQEITKTVLSDPSFDIEALFSTDFFADAYQQYLENLLDAFLNDRAIHEWLYPYYAYSMDQGKNKYIGDEMYFYAPPGDRNIFSAETGNPREFLSNAYNRNLYQHIYYTGRIYITASDFMNIVLQMPNYVAFEAVFLRAYGGIPNPEDMNVPGWTSADYEAFWQRSPLTLDSPSPFWLSYDISAEDFAINWNQLANEQAFYDAYLEFMDTIASGLGVFDMVSYSAGDDSYGAMYYEIIGKEASVTEIVALYIEEHPEHLEEHEPDLDTIPSSYDQLIAKIQKNLEELDAQISEQTDRRNELAAFLDSEESLRTRYDRLLADVQEYRSLLIQNLILFSSILVLLLLMALISLILFLRLVKKPKHLMLLKLEDGSEAAFSIRSCSKQNIAALQERLPNPPDGPQT